jgi:predicted secreted protein
MNPYEIAIVAVLVWWMVFFMALPFGAQPEEHPVKGHADSAPAKPRLWLKVGITTLITAVVTTIIVWVISSGMIHLGM